MTTCFRILAVAACLFTAGCYLRQAVQADVPAASSDTTTVALSVGDSLFFDRIVTFDTVFPDPKQRAMYMMHMPMTLPNGERWYGFERMPLSLDEDSPTYSSMVWMIWAPAGEFSPRGEVVEGGGHQEGFVEFGVRTPDAAYDVQVVENMRPNTMPAFDVRGAAEALVRRYVQASGTSPKEKPAIPRQGAPSVEDSSFFDRVVTFDAVFPDPKIRALYRMHAPMAEDGRRGHSFSLAPQPGMKIPRHHSVISVVWEPAGTSGPNESMRGMGGSKGGFIEYSVRTHDGVYDVRVVESMLLPNTLSHLPSFDVEGVAKRLVQRYSQELERK